MKLALSTVFTAVILTGCAGSASHKVLSSHQATDADLSCSQIDMEIAQAQTVIDGVNEDKDDISGADVVDGVLYFPFNLIAKHSNYDSALDAADRRISRLQELKTTNSCSTDSNDQYQALSQKLKELNKLHTDGMINDDEYKKSKLKLLGLND